MEVNQAVEILKQYSCTKSQIPDSPAAKQQLKAAILVISAVSDFENLGICADNPSEGFSSLASYLQALGYDYTLPSVTLEADRSVYIKFNTQKQNYYLDVYEGDYRGVLIAYQGEDPEVMGTYGYFPLNLFD
ncbi:DUF1824 family protein [Gloeocapsa sp. PCC 73106]|uniref:DUF1824 family protein n=1 Tax=Gloeocapsa sp. PCC 73106 TaxID=102232 RepID=UPI0002ABE96C|nr:DUF1824 family protein [Gloeocapsa sp. PCC 73106]ELR96956.1 protein of unknown function (DUF1824) [Gloeocapsa sp. PCC 73106]